MGNLNDNDWQAPLQLTTENTQRVSGFGPLCVGNVQFRKVQRQREDWIVTDAAAEAYCDLTQKDPTYVDEFETQKLRLQQRIQEEPLVHIRDLGNGCQLWKFRNWPRFFLVFDPGNKKVIACTKQK
jgi:hypothetical protein